MKLRIAVTVLMLALIVPIALSQTAVPAPVPETFVTMFNESVPEFDPHRSIYSSEAQIFTAVYEGLFSYDPATLEPLPAAAETWQKSMDGKTYTFSLRAEAKWSDGSLLLASDFVSAWFRLLDLNAQYAAFFDLIEGAADYRMGRDSNRAHVGIAAVDDKTLKVTLNRPAAYFTRLLCHHAFSPIPPSMISASAWENRIPFPVNGPYQFVEFSGTSLRLEKNPSYWDRASVSIQEMEIQFSDDDAAASRLFNNEQVHWLAGPGDYEAILMDQAIQINPMFATHYWYFDCSKTPWDDGRVRRALALLLPWDEVRDPSRYMIPATTLVLTLPGYSSAQGITARDKQEALELLDSAGYPLGEGLPEIRIHFADASDPKRVATLFKTTWEKELGMKVTLVPVPPMKYYETIGRGTRTEAPGMAHTTWIGDFADPEAFLQMWAPDSPLNEAGFGEEEFSALLAESYTREGRERLKLLAQAETTLLQTAGVIPLYHSFAASVIDIDYIDGWYQNALDIHPFKYFKFGTPSVLPNVAEAIETRGPHVADGR